MFEAIPSPHFGLNYDPSHLVRLRIDYLRVLEEFGERINHCHGKDTEILQNELYEYGTLPASFGAKLKFTEGSWRYTIPGRGLVNWGMVAEQLDRFGYQGVVSIELEDHNYWGTLEAEQQGIVEAAKFLAKHFKCVFKKWLCKAQGVRSRSTKRRRSVRVWYMSKSLWDSAKQSAVEF
ncbi:sugar phosphate isomerase/epimerase [Fodinisporobacter ferrooxydans]|uniref:Sugar phosphate isomerase/epimerase n=1 Tax=Fodinisporobacter ferrooxydans TaxID=2901836 RepID=A0ABY4CHI7_9BACL|nr:sugar phosphate isomerase/epimerase [Alicyclobacillaceae bacterium MYW30-H2]